MAYVMLFEGSGAGTVKRGEPTSAGAIEAITGTADGSVALDAKLFIKSASDRQLIAHLRAPAGENSQSVVIPGGLTIGRMDSTDDDLEVDFADTGSDHRVFVYAR